MSCYENKILIQHFNALNHFLNKQQPLSNPALRHSLPTGCISGVTAVHIKCCSNSCKGLAPVMIYKFGLLAD